MKSGIKSFIKRLLQVGILVLCLYGMGRLYYFLTDGFSVENITFDLPYNPDLNGRTLTNEEQQQLKHALDQPYTYLGKGCQSYVFLSQDQNYVIKFFKYQRYKLKPWIDYLPPLPAIVKYKQTKLAKKRKKLEGFLSCWRTAFDHLKEETGLLFVHLNKTTDLQRQLIIYDKMGFSHQVDLDQIEFCVQYKAEMLSDVLLGFKARGELAKGQKLITDLLDMLVDEYSRGYADNDHALMQNTGVFQGRPIHVDIGQMVSNESVKEPAVYYQELLNKTYKFQWWLDEHYPELALTLKIKLEQILGPAFLEMKPIFRE